MAEFDKEVPTNDEDQVAIVGGPESAPGGAGDLAPGGALGHYHTSLGEYSAAGAAEEEIGGPFGDGYANKSVDGGVGEGMTMEVMQGAVEQLTKQVGLLIGAMALKQPVSPAPRQANR